MTRWQRATLRVASLAVPRRLRSEWLHTWQSESYYVPSHERTAFCRGALKDATLMSWSHTGDLLDTPANCLVILFCCSAGIYFLGMAAAESTLQLSYWSDAKNDPIAAVLLILLLMGVGLIVGRQTVARPAGFRDFAFLSLKLACAVPIFYGVLLLGMALHAPVLHPMIAFLLVTRLIFADQLRRCPRCLHYLRTPVAIGSASDTFLHWYGIEALCNRCRARVEIPDDSAQYCAKYRFIPLDDSWNDLFELKEDLPG